MIKLVHKTEEGAKLNTISLDPSDNLPSSFASAISECWEGQYLHIDINGRDDFLDASRRLIESFLSSFNDKKKALLVFFFELSKYAKVWLDMERPNDENPAKLMHAVHECISKDLVIKSSVADLIFPPPQKRSGNVNIDDAYLVLHFLAHSMDLDRISELAPSFLNFAVTSYGIVIPEQQRRPLLKWCLEEGLPSALSNRTAQNIDVYLYK